MTRFARSLTASTAVGLIVAAGCLPSLAQDGAAGATSEIVVVGRGEGEGPGTPATQVNSERLDQEGRQRLDNTLRTVPGVFTRQNAQQPGVAVNIRGFEGSGRVNMSIDGVRQNFRFTGHEAGGFTYVDPNLLAGIDVVRGEVTGVGGGALAGRVNFRTLDVQDVVFGNKNWGVLSRLSIGSNGAGLSEMISGAYQGANVGVIGAVSKRNSTDYRSGDGTLVANSGQDLVSGLFKTNLAFGEGHTLQLGGVVYNNDFFANSYFQTLQNQTFTLKYRYDAPSPLVDLRVNVHYNNLRMHYTGSATGTGSALGRKIQDSGIGFDVSNVALFDVGAVGIRNQTGVEYFHDTVTGDTSGVNPSSGRSSVGGVFTDTTFRYGIVDVVAGLRYNFYTLRGEGTLPPLGAYSVDQSRGSVDPKLTLAVNVLPWLQPYVTWGRSMRAPTLQETMLGGSHPGGATATMYPNPNLVPEKSQGWELGFNVRREGIFTARDRFRGRANVYLKNVEDYIVGQYLGTASPAGTYYVNVAGTSRVQGVELEADYDARVVFARLGYAHADSKLPSQFAGLGAGQYLPKHTLTITAGARLLDERLTVGAQYKYVSAGLVAGYNSTFTGGLAVQGGIPYHLVDLFSTYKFSEQLEVSLKVTNLFNVQYTPFLNTTGAGAGRTFLASTQVRF